MTNLGMNNILNSIQESSASNTAKSQAFAREQMKYNAEQASINRQWQENMSNTAHQREVKDLISAGLNPVLSTGGQGSATPSGATATGSSGKVDESYSSALAGYLTTLINSATAVNTAGISASAMLGSAKMSADASRANAITNLAGTKFSTLGHYSSARYSANKSYEGTQYSSDTAYKGTKYKANASFISNLIGDLFKFAGSTKGLSSLLK